MKMKRAQSNVCPRKPGTGYDEEAVYQYLKSAGWSVRGAMRLAEEAGDRRTPKDPRTWSKCIGRKDLYGRYRRESAAEWKLFHNEREARKQHFLDLVAAALEPLIEEYGIMLGKALGSLKKRDNYELALLRKDFAFGPEAFDRLCRLYMRAVGLPEKITHSFQDQRMTTVLTYDEAEQQKRLSESGRITRPMIAKDLAEAKRLMETIDLGPAWALEEQTADASK